MQNVEIGHFGGIVEVRDSANLKKVLCERYGDDANEFLITHAGSAFPMLTILVRGNRSAMYFFPRDHHPGFVSVGDEAPGNLVTFFSGSPNEELPVSSEAIVPFEVALHAASEFIKTPALPSSVRWFEL